ncbi:MAG: hypothetical protein AAGJ87_08360, partial [Pseudomonadota bacterium]
MLQHHVSALDYYAHLICAQMIENRISVAVFETFSRCLGRKSPKTFRKEHAIAKRSFTVTKLTRFHEI